MGSLLAVAALRREGQFEGKKLLAVESLMHYLRTLDAQQKQPPRFAV